MARRGARGPGAPVLRGEGGFLRRRAMAAAAMCFMLLRGAGAGESVYDDREVMEQAFRAAGKLLNLMPDRHNVYHKPAAFADRELVATIKELQSIQRTISAAIRGRAGGDEINTHRTNFNERLGSVLKEYERHRGQ